VADATEWYLRVQRELIQKMMARMQALKDQLEKQSVGLVAPVAALLRRMLCGAAGRAQSKRRPRGTDFRSSILKRNCKRPAITINGTATAANITVGVRETQRPTDHVDPYPLFVSVVHLENGKTSDLCLARRSKSS